jgi:hypothetical protein
LLGADVLIGFVEEESIIRGSVLHTADATSNRQAMVVSRFCEDQAKALELAFDRSSGKQESISCSDIQRPQAITIDDSG